MGVDDDLAKAVRLHESGDLLAAGNLYREILAVAPDNVDALNLLGVVMHAAGDMELAIELITRATELAPDYAAPYINLGNALQASGQLADAVEQFDRALQLEPDAGIAACNLASALNELGRHEEAERVAERAIRLVPGLPDAQVNLGNAQLGLGKIDGALMAYTSALELNPRHAGAWFNLGNAHADRNDFGAALEPYRKAAEFDPRNAACHYNLGNAYQQLDQYGPAITSFEQVMALDPAHIDAPCNVASAWQSLGRTDKAVAILKETLAREALAGDEESVDLHWNLSLALLQNGDMEDGWREYEWRWQTPSFADFKRSFTAPRWAGEDLGGKTIYIHAEQGFGDALQFVRYVPLVAERGGRIILECRPELRRLFSGLDGVDACVDLGAAVTGFDLQIPMLSLPHVFATTLENLPTDTPYLNVPADVSIDGRLRNGDGYKVGIVWSGSPTRPDNHKRSCALSLWAPILAVPGVRFFSLQVGADRDQLQALEGSAPLTDLGRDFGDFADTAEAVDALDLIISVDTSVLHLAGALGKPAWALLSQPTGFLWMNERSDSPWYPDMRLFRQLAPGDWQPVVEAVAAALADAAGSGGPP